jgi:hypothetical protein
MFSNYKTFKPILRFANGINASHFSPKCKVMKLFVSLTLQQNKLERLSIAKHFTVVWYQLAGSACMYQT